MAAADMTTESPSFWTLAMRRVLHVPAWPSVVAAIVPAMFLLGCGSGAEMSLVDPTKYQFHSCAQLGREMHTLRERAQQLEALRDRAVRGSGGELVANLAYEPEYRSAVGNMRLIEAAARERNCNPPITATSNTTPR